MKQLFAPPALPSLLIGVMAVASAIILSVLLSPLVLGTTPVYGDFGGLLIPHKAFYARCLASGEAFDWMPHLMGGFFLTGEGEIGAYHPLHLFIYRWLPFPVAFGLDLAIACPLMLAGSFFFLRRYLSRAGALTGAALTAFSIFYMSLLGYPQMAVVLAHMPWLLWATGELFAGAAGPRRYRLCAAIGFLTASQVLFGHPPALLYSLVTEAAFCLFLLLERGFSPAACACLLAGKLLGASMGAVQLWSTYAVFAASTRSGLEADAVLFFSTAPVALRGLVAPYLLWSGVPGMCGIYFGAVHLILVGWWLAALKTAPPRSWVAAAALGPRPAGQLAAAPSRGPAIAPDHLAVWGLIFAVFTFWMATGVFGKLYYLQLWLPVVGKIRAPARYLILSQFGLCVVAAVAFDKLVALVREGRKLPWLHLVVPWSLAAASLATALYFATTAPASSAQWLQSSLYPAPLLFLAAAFALSLACRSRPAGLLLLAVVISIDLGFHGLGHRPVRAIWSETQQYEQWKEENFGPPGPIVGRLFHEHHDAGRLTLHGYRMINGYTGGLTPRRWLDYDDTSAMRVAGVRWYTRHPALEPSESEDAVEAAKYGWRRVTDPLPRFRLVNHLFTSHDPVRDLRRIDIRSTALVSRDLDPGPATEGAGRPPAVRSLDPAPGEAGEVTGVRDDPGLIRLTTTASGRRLLVVSESHDPGWQALVDGKRVGIERVNGDFMGCLVPAGRHQVVLRFRPASLRYGRPFSLAALLVALLLWLAPLLRFSRRRLTERGGR